MVFLRNGSLAPACLAFSPPYDSRLRDRRYPAAFDPTRFSEDVSGHGKHSFMWIPSGGGAHKCIGMRFSRMLFLLTFRELIANYQVEYAKDGYFPAKLQHFPFTRPLDSLPLRLVARS